jgi:hypothetical protein
MQDAVEPDDRCPMHRRLAAAVGVERDVRREQVTQTLHLAVPGRGEEGFRDRVIRKT